jgi:hypothetical protein
MEIATLEDAIVVEQVSEHERIVKIKDHNGVLFLSHQYCNSEGHWRPCCVPIPLSVYTDARARVVIERCPHYRKREGHEAVLPALRKHH